MCYWSSDAIIYPFNEVILEGLASFGSWCGEEAADHHREAVHSLLWFYTEAQEVVPETACGTALRNQQFWKAPRWRGRLPRCGLAAPDPCSACLPGPDPWCSLGTSQVTRSTTLLVRTNRSPLLPGLFHRRLSPGWCPRFPHLSPEQGDWFSGRCTLGFIYLVVF